MKLVILDVDGTLLDSQDHIVEAQRRAFVALGLTPPSRARSLSIVGLSLHEAFLSLTDDATLASRLTIAYKEAWTVIRSEPGFAEILYPGAADMIAALRADPAIALGIATGKMRPGIDRLIDAQGWDGVFATIQTADGHPSKPHPSMILTAMRESGCSKGETMMVGDTTFDVAMAIAAGVRPIGVAWGYHDPRDLRAAGAHRVAESFDALRAILAGADTLGGTA